MPFLAILPHIDEKPVHKHWTKICSSICIRCEELVFPNFCVHGKVSPSLCHDLHCHQAHHHTNLACKEWFTFHFLVVTWMMMWTYHALNVIKFNGGMLFCTFAFDSEVTLKFKSISTTVQLCWKLVGILATWQYHQLENLASSSLIDCIISLIKWCRFWEITCSW